MKQRYWLGRRLSGERGRLASVSVGRLPRCECVPGGFDNGVGRAWWRMWRTRKTSKGHGRRWEEISSTLAERRQAGGKQSGRREFENGAKWSVDMQDARFCGSLADEIGKGKHVACVWNKRRLGRGSCEASRRGEGMTSSEGRAFVTDKAVQLGEIWHGGKGNEARVGAWQRRWEKRASRGWVDPNRRSGSQSPSQRRRALRGSGSGARQGKGPLLFVGANEDEDGWWTGRKDSARRRISIGGESASGHAHAGWAAVIGRLEGSWRRASTLSQPSPDLGLASPKSGSRTAKAAPHDWPALQRFPKPAARLTNKQSLQSAHPQTNNRALVQPSKRLVQASACPRASRRGRMESAVYEALVVFELLGLLPTA